MQGKKLIVKFAAKGQDSFYDTVKLRVEEYFRANNLKKTANRKMKIKTAVMLSLYFVPLIVILAGLTSPSLVLFYGAWILMGLGIVGIGTSVMHDSNHGSYSNNKTVNSIFGNILNFIGGYAPNWRIQHNVLHHTYTNLDGLDEDIEAGFMLRMSPNKPRKKFHRFQHIYAWFLYMLMNLFWITAKDYRQIVKYAKEDLLRKEKLTLRKAVIELSLLKVLYFTYILALPIMFSGFEWYHVVGGFVIMHMIAGLSLALIFQPAHVMETSSFPDPPPTRKMEDTWAVHQLLNTTNFGTGSTVTGWFIGGLNFQIEHHLFPQICHIHYPKIAPIVEQVAKEFNLPYNVQPTFAHAIFEHGRMLKILGEGQETA